MAHRPAPGALALVVVSALCFGTLAIFGKAAYARGIAPLTLLTWRFLGAAALLWIVVVATRAPLPRGRAWIVPGLLGVGYFLQSAAYFAALQRISASQTSLLLYTFPVFVTLGSMALFHERLTAVKAAALVAAVTGTAFVVGGGGFAPNPIGIAYGFGTALAYTAYILYGNRTLAGIPRMAVSATVMTTAGALFLVCALVSGAPLGLSSAVAQSVAGVVVVGTVVPVWLFLAGMPSVGASTASIVSTLEPLTTVSLAIALLGEHLTPLAALGMVLILGSTVAIARAPVARPAQLPD